MTLEEYIEEAKLDRNLFWKISDGQLQCLLVEAIDQIDQLRADVEQLRALCADRPVWGLDGIDCWSAHDEAMERWNEKIDAEGEKAKIGDVE